MKTTPGVGRMAGPILLLACAAGLLPAQTFERGPAHSPHGPLTTACGSCHTSTSWTTLRSLPEFNHNQETRYPLRGYHESVTCRQCHVKLVFANTGTKCADCHADIHRRQFGARCDECHTVKGWQTAARDIRGHENRFPLLGAHATVECADCHRGAAAGQFTGLSTQCFTCHMKDYDQARPIGHRAAGFPVTCETCHGFDNWRTSRFDHARFAEFPLEGAHATIECVSCHVGGRFSGTPADCFGCHARDFSSAQDPNHIKAGFSKTCALCHTTSTWKGARFDHNSLTSFALTGAHARVDCASCHLSGRFAGTPTACYGCHLRDFEAAKNPDHVKANFATDCSRCHTTDGWQGAKFDHGLSGFPLTGAHLQVACAQCHPNGRFTGTPAQCSGCHLQDFNKTTNPNHAAAGFTQDCAQCHTTVQWKGAKFNHNNTKFALTGAHVTVDCAQCHVNNRFAGTPLQCSGCHLQDFNKTTNPNHAAAGLPQDCTLCHTTSQWKGAKFDHNNTKFALTGAHVSVDCAQCHVNNKFAGTPSQCSGCHLADFNKTTNPNHVAAGFPQDCTLCHTTTQWKGAKFDHNNTKFALTGAHVTVDCAQCHVNNKFAGTPTQCSGCHLPDYNKTTSPSHVAAGFPQDCTLCHTTVQWKGAKFDHNNTKFALTGAHVSVDCAQCHVNNKFAGTPSQCSGCHLQDFNKTTNPNHVAAGFPQDCTLCHNTTQWKGAVFDHSARTPFPLTGAHLQVACSQCHANNRFAGTPMQCSGCHLADYNKTTDPNHVAAGFPQDCSLCHNTTQWKGAVFDHSARTKFPLTGAHLQVSCSQCHVNNVFAGTPTQCSGCHLADYNKTSNPNHAAAGFPTDCSLCHTTATWQGAKFDHNTATKFPLTGAHVQVACSQCHVNNKFAGTPTQCSACHLADYNKTSNPNHAAAGFPTDCSLCHSTTNWLGATFNHSQTKFPLTGAHVSVQCSVCHKNNVYAGLSTACVSCHLADYNGANNPNHVSAGFPQQCEVCHTTSAWTPSSFNHSTTGFPLTGKHTSVPCTSCHIGGKYAGTPTDCYSCHKADYNSTTNPNHAAAAFPTDCSLCHTTQGWSGATFNHTAFPIYSGTHAGKWTTCGDCHTNPSNYQVFSCITCHAHDQATMNPKHSGVRGYVYNSTSCYSCHPQGQAGG